MRLRRVVEPREQVAAELVRFECECRAIAVATLLIGGIGVLDAKRLPISGYALASTKIGDDQARSSIVSRQSSLAGVR